MKSGPPPPPPRLSSQEDLTAIPYKDTISAKPPIIITGTLPPRNAAHRQIFGLRRPNTASQQLSPSTARSKLQDDVRRDSGLAPSTSSTRDSRTTLATDLDSIPSIRHSPSLPTSLTQDASSITSPKTEATDQASQRGREDLLEIPQLPFKGILTEIPTGSFEDLTTSGQVEFSKRGSMLIGGRKAIQVSGTTGGLGKGRLIGSRKQQDGSSLSPAPNMPERTLSSDDEILSQKVRSMYEGSDRVASEAAEFKPIGDGRIEEEVLQTPLASSAQPNGFAEPLANGTADSRAASQAKIQNVRTGASVRDDHELAGGIEDWEDLNGGDVDRYGFIVPRKLSSQTPSINSSRAKSPDPPRIQRVSTLLQLASDAPRRQRSRTRKSEPGNSSSRSTNASALSRPPSGIVRPPSSQSSYRSISGGSSRIRSATNKMPHNKDRRCVDEAGDMLTLPPGLADIAEDEDSRMADDLKRREWEREEKWRKMAKIVRNDKHGGGMVFEFDTRSPKVIERTWKGIPDRWRATAWHAFLTASAKKRKGCPSDNELISAFKMLLDRSSPDDVQIDIDVPRTINSHIMFRRRYRGGQRLLFRVLHCLSIYFPDTGYVQGMAALAATLLCYFDEEMTFVVLVRLWQLRDLERLYQSGFEGLMQALEELEKDWLGNGDVATKLVSLQSNSSSLSSGRY